MVVSHLSAWFLAMMSPDEEIEKDFPGICALCICMEAGFGTSPGVGRRIRFNTPVCQEVPTFKSQGGYVLKVSV